MGFVVVVSGWVGVGEGDESPTFKKFMLLVVVVVVVVVFVVFCVTSFEC